MSARAWDSDRAMSPRERECAEEWLTASLAGDYNLAAYYRDAGLAAKEERLFSKPVLLEPSRRSRRRAKAV